jgi:hypothetical protein
MPQIRVDEKVHKQVKKIADANFRGVGDQVAYWVANECSHPTEMREVKEVSVAPEGIKDADNTLRILHCRQCDRYIILGNSVEISRALQLNS